jgi:hypothetical protein
MVSSTICSRIDACHLLNKHLMAQCHAMELSCGTTFIDLLHVGTIHCLGKADHDRNSSMIYGSQQGNLDTQ